MSNDPEVRVPKGVINFGIVFVDEEAASQSERILSETGGGVVIVPSQTRRRHMVRCPNCDGGWIESWEDGRVVVDACYHCGNTGQITEERAYQDRVGGVAASLAIEAVRRLREARNSDPDGEGWAFAAAENRLSEHDYTEGYVYSYTNRYLKILGQIQTDDPSLLEVLIDALDPPEESPQEPQPLQAPTPTEDTEQIPF